MCANTIMPDNHAGDKSPQETIEILQRAFQVYKHAVMDMEIAVTNRGMFGGLVDGIAVRDDEWALRWQAARQKADFAEKVIMGELHQPARFMLAIWNAADQRREGEMSNE
jgi:hypothetical protein